MYIDELMPERCNSIANTWSYIFLATTHQCKVCIVNILQEMRLIIKRLQYIHNIDIYVWLYVVHICKLSVQNTMQFVLWYTGNNVKFAFIFKIIW